LAEKLLKYEYDKEKNPRTGSEDGPVCWIRMKFTAKDGSSYATEKWWALKLAEGGAVLDAWESSKV